MTPRIIARQLAALRRRERVSRFAWGFARLIAVAAVLLTVACYVDWRIDMRQETPHWLRVSMLLGQIGVAIVLAVFWLLPPLFGGRDDAATALLVEEKMPALSHRLISAVQLNRRGADTRGMSPALIGAVTREAEEAARSLNFDDLLDPKRLWNSLGVTTMVAVFGAATWFTGSVTIGALLARQGLADVEIPRTAFVKNLTKPVWPAGEPAEVRVEVHSATDSDVRCDVLIVGDNGQKLEQWTEGRGLPSGFMTVAAGGSVPAEFGDFTIYAWSHSGRLKPPGRVRRVPRPAITRQDAWTLLPKHVGLAPDGRCYALPQTKGEIVGLPGSSATIAFVTQKPVVKATLELLGIATAREAANAGSAISVLRTLPLELSNNGSEGSGTFELRAEETAYRIVVEDEYGFANLDPPRRGIKIVEEDAPQVVLLPEHFAPDQANLFGRSAAEDFEVEGVPIPLGGSIRIAYAALHPYGLGSARLQYRINEGPWRPFTLQEVPAGDGPFDGRTGAFATSKPGDQVQFHAVRSADPARFLGRVEGGGRFDFQTRGLPELQVGDKIEFFVEVSNRQPGEPKFGHSEVRLKAIVSVPQLVQWIDATLRQEDRIRQLELRQRGVFGK